MAKNTTFVHCVNKIYTDEATPTTDYVCRNLL